MTPYLLRTTDLRTLCERLGYGSGRVARFRRRSDRLLQQPPSEGAQAATASDGSPEPSDEQVTAGVRIAASIVFATADARRVG